MNSLLLNVGFDKTSLSSYVRTDLKLRRTERISKFNKENKSDPFVLLMIQFSANMSSRDLTDERNIKMKGKSESLFPSSQYY